MSKLGDRLLITTGLASVVFTIGTALHAFVIVNAETLERMMVLAGTTPNAADAQGFLTAFRAVGCLYIAGNAIGILALQGKPRKWLFWVVITVNATQAAGLMMVPPEMFTAVEERFGPAGTLPSIITDGGAAVLALTLMTSALLTRSTWAWGRPARTTPSGP